MKFLMNFFEYLAGVVGLITTLFTLLLGLLISVIEVPRYLRIKSM